jgi:hypothetical protein
MGTKTRTEIVVETHRVLVIRRSCSSLEGWCARCGEHVRMIRLAEAALAGLSLQAIYQQARAGKLHFTDDSDGLSSVCLNSLPR